MVAIRQGLPIETNNTILTKQIRVTDFCCQKVYRLKIIGQLLDVFQKVLLRIYNLMLSDYKLLLILDYCYVLPTEN